MKEYDIPTHVKTYITGLGYKLPWNDMREYINLWHSVLRADGQFWDYEARDGDRTYRVHRRSIKPAKRVSDEWASLIMNDDTTIATSDEAVNEWLAAWENRENFYGLGQELIADAFALGTAAWALWVDIDAKTVKARRYDARMVLPLSWDDDGVKECAFATKTYIGGKPYDQLQLHLNEDDEYVIRTVLFDEHGKQAYVEGVAQELQTGCKTQTFAVVKPAIKNAYVDFSPYGQSIFADHVDVLQSVDLAYDAIFNEVDLAKMRIFMSDMMFEVGGKGNGALIPFGKEDATIYRKVAATDENIKEFAPGMRTDAQRSAYRLAIQTLGDVCGFGSQYFDMDKAGGIKTATEVSSDNSALMRNIRRHENLIGGEIETLIRSLVTVAREVCGERLNDPEEVRVTFDDSIITDTMAEKAADMAEVGVTMNAWEFRMKWYGEDEETAKANVPGNATIDIFGE